MKIKDLKKIIENLDDNMEVVISGHDHAFNILDDFSIIKAEKNGRNLFEYDSYEGSDDTTETVVEVLWLG